MTLDDLDLLVLDKPRSIAWVVGDSWLSCSFRVLMRDGQGRTWE